MNGGTKKIPAQVNGKLKLCVIVDADASVDKILEMVKADEQVKEILEKNDVVKEVYVPGKIFNIVVKNK